MEMRADLGGGRTITGLLLLLLWVADYNVCLRAYQRHAFSSMRDNSLVVLYYSKLLARLLSKGNLQLPPENSIAIFVGGSSSALLQLFWLRVSSA
jgi:hypothetical protein